jgi:probable F420-dependent oxidoreductase
MRYGVIFSCQDPEGSPIGHPAVYESALACAVAAEEQGYDWINVTEHHVAADGYLPALFVLLAAMAARTERIRLSTGMLILTLHSPLRIAEEAAVLDIISGGRVTLGVAAGYREVEFEAMQVDYRTRGKRFVESLELLRLAWTGEPFTFTGEIFDLPELVVRPVPIQRPGIPLWLGGTTDVALRRAVRHGAPVFPGATDEIGVVAQRMASYDRLREELEPSAHPAHAIAPRELVLPRLAVVADTTEEARRRALPGIRAMLQTYQSWGLPVDFTRMLTDWELLDDLVIAGDPDHCRACVQRYAELGLTDLLLQFAMPTLEPAVIAESQARFMSEVATPARVQV